MVPRNRLMLLLGACLFLALACTGGGILTPTPRGGTVPTEKPNEAPPSGDLTITVENLSKRDICEVYISPTGQESWGENKLSGSIKSGKSKTLTVAKGQYDVIVYDCDGVALASGWEIDKPYTLMVGGPGLVELVLKNQSSAKVCYVYISPETNDSWGDDWMGLQESLASGESRVFFLKPGTYDLMAQDCDENTLAEEYAVEINDDITWTLRD